MSFVATPAPSLWIQSRRFDLGFFILSGLACLLVLIPYVLFREQSIWPIYNAYLLFFGLPHNYLTWATLLPEAPRKTFKMESIVTLALVWGALCALIPFVKGTQLGDWLLSIIAYWSLWHAYRQHHGICKVYDSVQAKRTGDHTIFKDRYWLNAFFGFAAFAIVVWVFTHPHVDYLLSPDDKHEFIHPTIPRGVYHLYLGVTATLGVMGLRDAVWKRWRAGKFIPWPQLGLITVALLTYFVPYLFLGLEALPIPVAIGTMFHNIQYFGFVWIFERRRAPILALEGNELAIPQRLALSRSWKSYFGLAFLYSLAVIVAYLIAPKYYGLAFIYFIGIAHYTIDGRMWRRDTNTLLPAVIDRWAGVPSSQPAAAARSSAATQRPSSASVSPSVFPSPG